MNEPRSIAILSLGPIGDAILTTPLIDRIAHAFDNAEITVLCSPRNREVHELNPNVHEVLVIRNSPSGVIDSIRMIAGRKWDLYIDPKDHVSTTSRLLGTLLRYETGVVSPGNLSFVRDAIIIPPADGSHFVDGTFGALLALEVDVPESRRPELPQFDSTRLGETEGIVLNISAGSSERYWPIAKWRDLIVRLGNDIHDPITVVSAPGDASLAAEVTDGLDATALQTPRLIDLYRVISQARLVVSTDTSVVHVASGYDRPTVALFSSDMSNAHRFAPLASVAVVVQPENELRSIAEIDVKAVASACRTVYSRTVNGSDQKSAPSEM